MVKIVSTEDLNKLPHRYQVMFAVFCAEQVVGLVKEQYRETCLKTIDTAKKWLRGEVSTEECIAAGDYAAARTAGCATGYAGAAASAAYAAAYASGTGGAYAAAYAANAAGDAAYADNNENKVVKEQWNYYHELLNLDSTLEKILVG
jgi:hypothetical protein